MARKYNGIYKSSRYLSAAGYPGAAVTIDSVHPKHRLAKLLACKSQSEAIVDGMGEGLFGPEIPFGGLDRRVT